MIVLYVYVHTHPYRWHICDHSVPSILLCSSLLPLSCASCLAFPDFVRRTLCVYFCTVTLCCVIPNSVECWTRCGQFIRETQQGEGRMVETCARSCVLWSICLHRPFKLLPQSPASPLWLASTGFVAASDNVTWGIQWFLICSETLNFLLFLLSAW